MTVGVSQARPGLFNGIARNSGTPRIRIDPDFAALRDNPRFQRLITSKAAGE
jgi:hypothetical protein